MTPWISMRPAHEVAAELAHSRGPLAGERLVVQGNTDRAGCNTPAQRPDVGNRASLDSPAVMALRAAGAVPIGTTDGAGAATALGTGAADIGIGIGIDAGPGWVSIRPTAGTISAVGGTNVQPEAGSALVARNLELANRAMRVIAGTGTRRWPADTRFAVTPGPVVAVPGDLTGGDRPRRAAFNAAVAALTATGAHIVAIDTTALLADARLERTDPAGGRRTAPRDFAGAEPLMHAERDRLRSVAMAALDGVDALLAPTFAGLGGLLDGCAVTMAAELTVWARAFDDATALDVAALASGGAVPIDVWPLAAAEVAELVVFGAHLRGGPLVHQLTDLGARWAGELTTSPHYRMTVLPTEPAKPAVTRVPDGCVGARLRGHRWQLSPAALGRFLAALPAPMQLGKVEFDDGSWRTAFGCDAAAATGLDISGYGSWPAAIAAGAV